MNIAIPLFEKRISPYFDYAPELLLVQIEGGAIIGRQGAALAGWDVRQRVEYVKNKNVQILICGGITHHTEAEIERSGIRVIPWVSGEAEQALALYLKGRLEPGTMLCGRRRRRWCFCIGRNKHKP